MLLSAGFGADDARRGLTALANIAQSAARTALHVSTGQHDYHAETVAALQDAADDEYPALRTMLAGAPSPDALPFEFEVDVAISVLKSRLR